MIRSVILVFSLFLATLALPSHASAATLQGTVVDPQSRPVSGARVTVATGTTIIATLTTGTNGTFGPMELPDGEYDVAVTAPSLRALPRHVKVTGTIDLKIALALTAVETSVVVSAAQVDQPVARVTDSVAIIDRSDLEARQTETASDALRLVPGFSLTANGGRGALMSIFPRGGESDFTLVLMDGLPLNAFGGGFDAAHLSTAGIDRIEVVRGPQSAVYGSGATGGVINIISRQGGPLQGRVLFEGGQQGTTRVDLAANGTAGHFSWGGSFERLASDGDTTFRTSINQNVSNDDYERLIGTGSLAWSDRATRRVRVDAQYGRDDKGNPGPYGSDPFGFYSGLDTITRTTNHPRGVIASALLGDPSSLRHTVQVGWSDVPSEFASPFGDSTAGTHRLTGRYQADLERGHVGWSFGMEAIRERGDNTFVTDDNFDPIPVTRTILGLFAESRWDIGARAAITAGVRVERIQRDALATDGFRPAFDDDVIWSPNPKVSAMWYLQGDRNSDGTHGWTKIRGGAGTGIRPPNVFEIGFTDNPSLKPERSRSGDIGLEHAFPGALVLADVTYFANRYDDMIVSVGSSFSGASKYRTDNIANAKAQGVEVGVRWQSRFGLSVRGAYTYLDTEVLGVDNFPDATAPPYVVGDQLIRRPRHSGSLDARYTRGRVQMFLTINGRGEMADFEPNFASDVLTTPGYVVSAIGGSFRIAQSLEAYARVTNLFNRAYEDALGFPAQARSASVGLRVALGR